MHERQGTDLAQRQGCIAGIVPIQSLIAGQLASAGSQNCIVGRIGEVRTRLRKRGGNLQRAQLLARAQACRRWTDSDQLTGLLLDGHAELEALWLIDVENAAITDGHEVSRLRLGVRCRRGAARVANAA